MGRTAQKAMAFLKPRPAVIAEHIAILHQSPAFSYRITVNLVALFVKSGVIFLSVLFQKHVQLHLGGRKMTNVEFGEGEDEGKEDGGFGKGGGEGD